MWQGGLFNLDKAQRQEGTLISSTVTLPITVIMPFSIFEELFLFYVSY